MVRVGKYYYTAFGLSIESDLEIPALPVIPKQQSGIRIKLGKVPLALEEPQSEGVCFQASPGKLLLRVEKVARFLITNGNEIMIEPDSRTSLHEVMLFLLGSAFGALLHQLGFLPIHGSALAMGKDAIILSGISGAGKSTLAAALCKKGFRFLADDIAVVSFGELCVPLVQPAYPQLKLWTDSLLKLGESKHTYTAVRTDLQKYAVPMPLKFTSHPVNLAIIYALSSQNNEGFEIENLKGIEKFNVLKSNTYRFPFLSGLNLQPQHFSLCTSLAERVTIKKLVRSSKGFHLDNLVEGIKEDIRTTIAAIKAAQNVHG